MGSDDVAVGIQLDEGDPHLVEEVDAVLGYRDSRLLDLQHLPGRQVRDESAAGSLVQADLLPQAGAAHAAAGAERVEQEEYFGIGRAAGICSAREEHHESRNAVSGIIVVGRMRWDLLIDVYCLIMDVCIH